MRFAKRRRTAGCIALAAITTVTVFASSAGANGTRPLRSPTLDRFTQSSPSHDGIPAFRHVFVVVMENLDYQSALATPGLAALAHRYALATNYYAVSHPSLPNYLALTSGSTWGITSDCVECFVDVPNLAEQLLAAHISFGAYMEGIPAPCFLADYGGNDYASKHDPFRYYVDVRDSRVLCDAIRPESELPRLLAGPASAVPRFVWVTPDLCHDGHNCPPATAAAWLDGFVSEVTHSAAWKNRGVLFVTWDESEGSDAAVIPPNKIVACCGGGQIATFVIDPKLRPGLRVGVAYNHYSLLATIEDAFHLALLQNARSATPLSAFFDSSRS
jgi:phosphatidylinositol-3-phosphatase